MYPHWGCTLIYQPLSYPFRSLILLCVCNSNLSSRGWINKIISQFKLQLNFMYVCVCVCVCGGCLRCLNKTPESTVKGPQNKGCYIKWLGKQKMTWTVSCSEKLNEKLFIYRPLPTIGVELLDKGVLTPLPLSLDIIGSSWGPDLVGLSTLPLFKTKFEHINYKSVLTQKCFSQRISERIILHLTVPSLLRLVQG